MDALNLTEHQFVIPAGMPVTLDSSVYKNASFVCRLLTLLEIRLIDKYTSVINTILHEGKEFDLDDDFFFMDTQDLSIQKVVVEEEVFKRCVQGIMGVDAKINMDTIEAGIVSKIGQAILRKSLDLYIGHADFIERAVMIKQSYFDIVKSLLCRYQNENMDNLDQMPMDKLLKRFAILRAAFPEETEINNKESED